MTNRTITVATSDHGDMMGAHGILGKQLMFEQSASVPLVVRVPGQSPGHYSQPVSHIDFVPTILDPMRNQPHGQCAGQSKASLIRGQTAPGDFVFLQWSPNKDDIELKTSALASKAEVRNCLRESTRAVVSPEGWKLCLRDRDKNELYNLRDDPDERRNLYYTGGYQGTVAALTKEIHRWQRRVHDKVGV